LVIVQNNFDGVEEKLEVELGRQHLVPIEEEFEPIVDDFEGFDDLPVVRNLGLLQEDGNQHVQQLAIIQEAHTCLDQRVRVLNDISHFELQNEGFKQDLVSREIRPREVGVRYHGVADVICPLLQEKKEGQAPLAEPDLPVVLAEDLFKFLVHFTLIFLALQHIVEAPLSIEELEEVVVVRGVVAIVQPFAPPSLVHEHFSLDQNREQLLSKLRNSEVSDCAEVFNELPLILVQLLHHQLRKTSLQGLVEKILIGKADLNLLIEAGIRLVEAHVV